MKVVFAIVACAFLAYAEAKCFSSCELAHELQRLGVPHSQVHHWVCMAKAESNMCTTATNHNTDGSADYGIFQINSYWNCDPRNGHRTKNGCGHPCSDFMNTNLADDVACIKLQMRWHHNSYSSFSYGYRAKCQGISSSYLHC